MHGVGRTDSLSLGYFVHDQGRGHARRCASILRELPGTRHVAVFTSNPGLLPSLPPNVEIIRLPSLYDSPGDVPSGLERLPPPESMHFVPLGWPGIRQAMATVVDWFHRVDPALFVVDVSAELTLLARLCSVPCMTIRQHGQRLDPAHRMAYDSCVGMVAPFDARLEQPDVPAAIRDKTFYSGGLNPSAASVPVAAASRADDGRRRVVVLSGGGGDGFPLAPLCDGARALPDADWIVLGQVRRAAEDSPPANLRCLGWVHDAPAHLAAADIVIASAGDSTVHEICQLGKPYLCLPEWRYFDEQEDKASALAALNAAHRLFRWPEGRDDWLEALARAERIDRPLQRSLVDPMAARKIAGHLEEVIARLWCAPAGESSGT